MIRRLWGDARLRQFVSFFAGSALGLVIDLGGFWVLSSLGIYPWLANLISSAASISAVYLFVTRYTFAVGTRASTYALFLGWYALNIAVTSATIQLLTSATDVPAFGWKLASVPISFTANFLFSRFLFIPRLRGRNSDEGQAEPEQDGSAND